MFSNIKCILDKFIKSVFRNLYECPCLPVNGGFLAPLRHGWRKALTLDKPEDWNRNIK